MLAKMKSLNPTPVNGQNTDSFSRNDPKLPIQVAIVDDDENDRRMMSQSLEKSGEFVCVGAYRSANEALAVIPKVLPQVVLMDIRMPGMDGHECSRRLRVIMVQLKIIIVTGLLDIDTMNKSLQAGADGYLTKPAGVAQFLAVIKLTVRDGIPATDKSRETPVSSRREADPARAGSPLTIRENEVMALLAKGYLDKEIASELEISFSAVRFHLHHIYQKLPAGNRTEAVIKGWDTNRR
jgi:DNA-binding NarL/FixJ family response regulator